MFRDGQIVEEGGYKELVRKGGYFSKLVSAANVQNNPNIGSN